MSDKEAAIEAKFIHLRVHSEYSLCEGAIKIPSLLDLTKDNNMPAVAVTDNCNMFGALNFSAYACKKGLQPITGVDLLIDLNSDDKMRTSLDIERDLRKLPLFAATEEGYLNLISLASKGYLLREGDITPHITLDLLKGKTAGVIAFSGGVEGVFGKDIIDGQHKKVEENIKIFKELFPDENFYIELMRHGTDEEEATEQAFIDLAYKHNLPLVATNDVYFATRDMHEAQDALMCIGQGRYVTEQDRKKLTPEHYFKSQEEMVELFSDIPEAIENTVRIAKKCQAMAHPRKPTLPHYDLPEGITETQEFRRLSYEGLKERLETKFKLENIPEEKHAEVTKMYTDRMEYEMGIIEQMDFPGYFLIVADFIVWSKEHDIPVGPGRGSGAGSVVAWAMKITDIDSMKFSLFFERFLNPERVSMPDFDVDFCQAGRGDVIKYVQEKYGDDYVAAIITFGKLQAKAVLKDVGRVLQMAYSQVDRICKMIPFSSAETITLEKAIEMDEDLQKARETDPEVAKLLDIGLKLEGLNRHSSTHAAGVVIGDKPLEKICCLSKDNRSEMPAIGYSMKFCDMVGLVKFDFLGLKTLTTLKRCRNLIRQRNIEINVNEIPIDDKPTYDMLSKGDSIGVFQIESSGMRSILRQMKPTKIEEVIALISLFRPGPMDNIPSFIRRKHGEEEVYYPHPKIKHILEETYGIIVYQEQVMEIAKILAGYSLGGADMLRRAMGKKIKEEMVRQRGIFVEGCEKNGVGNAKAEEIFDLLAKFASYGFNKAHAAAYAMISYQTAWLKRHYPVEFMAATMNMDIHDSEKINFFKQEVVDKGIQILPPDLNKSEAYFSVELIDTDATKEEMENAPVKKYDLTTGKEIAIRFGLGAIKAVGIGMMEELEKERSANGEYKDLFNYVERLNSKIINKKAIEALSKAGAFDNIHKNRRQVHDSCEVLTRYSSTYEEEQNSNQMSLFGGTDSDVVSKPLLANVDDWVGEERLRMEFEAFGFFFKDHPMDAHKEALETRGITWSNQVKELGDNSEVWMAGVVADKKMRSGPKGRYAYVYLSDADGITETAVFNSDLILECRDLMEVGTQIVMKCLVRVDEAGIRVLGRDIIKLRDFIENNEPGSIEKVRIIKKRSGKGKGAEYWKKKNAEEGRDRIDPVMEKAKAKAEEKRRKHYYKEMNIIMTNTNFVEMIQKFLKPARVPDDFEWPTKVYLTLVQNSDKEGETPKSTKFLLNDKYFVTDVERERFESGLGRLKYEFISGQID